MYTPAIANATNIRNIIPNIAIIVDLFIPLVYTTPYIYHTISEYHRFIYTTGYINGMSNKIRCEECGRERVNGMIFYEYKANEYRCPTCAERVRQEIQCMEEY